MPLLFLAWALFVVYWMTIFFEHWSWRDSTEGVIMFFVLLMLTADRLRKRQDAKK